MSKYKVFILCIFVILLSACKHSDSDLDSDYMVGFSSADVYNNQLKGFIYDNSYMNITLGLRYALPADLEIVEAEEVNLIAKTMHSRSENNDVPMSDLDVHYELVAMNYNNSDSVIIILEKLQPSVTDDLYQQVVLNQLKEHYGIESPTIGEEMLADITFDKLLYAINRNGDIRKQNFYYTRVADYMLTITLTYDSPEGLDTLLSGFSSLRGFVLE